MTAITHPINNVAEAVALQLQRGKQVMLEDHYHLPIPMIAGIAHPHRFGIAAHTGVTTGIASIGVAKPQTKQTALYITWSQYQCRFGAGHHP